MAVSGICVSNWKEETPVLKVYSEAEVHRKRVKKKGHPLLNTGNAYGTWYRGEDDDSCSKRSEGEGLRRACLSRRSVTKDSSRSAMGHFSLGLQSTDALCLLGSLLWNQQL